MAGAVAGALKRHVPLLVEAGTGTGKTLAYLAPGVLSGLKLVVSTGTKNLQDQVNQKELPLLQKAMHPALSWAVLKGRTNYLCQRRFQAFASQPDLGLDSAGRGLAKLQKWVETTKTGDLDQIRGGGLNPALIPEITSSSEQCLGGRCPQREKCFLLEARRRAAEADILVVNHHLFLADLSLKAQGHGEALPRYQAVIFDEAHLLADVATQAFGINVSQRRLSRLLQDVNREAGTKGRHAQAASACFAAGTRLFAELSRMAGPGGGNNISLLSRHLEILAPLGENLGQALDDLAAHLGGDEEQEALAGRAQTLAMDLEAVARPVAGSTVAWATLQDGRAALNLSPVDVGPHLDAALYQETGRLVFTSATLAAGPDLEPARQRLGLPSETVKLVVPTPFDQRSQALLYVPGQMPYPQSPDFPRAVAQEVEALLQLTRGRAFVLFTSRRNLDMVSNMLMDKLPFTCLVQGQEPRMKLLQRFVEESPSVLFATASFWQGVDVPGQALSAVIIDKLPFSPPDEPLVAARMELLEQEGRNGFAHLMVPEAILSLRQGLGRLLRTPEDRGLLAVLDVRLYGKPYGRRFLKALEPTPVTRSKKEVAAFFEHEPEVV